MTFFKLFAAFINVAITITMERENATTKAAVSQKVAIFLEKTRHYRFMAFHDSS
ncbi:hypothetical protein ES319_A04G029100v1 [Gossypium barbadense]|uniref:Uncharacterized protein n=2 Tax=Gossypium TaxID=3633 RepID=A0A5J5W3A2_GOSBA|nr:hypothetical protein ES319_A04G029100v1 [Gossypium barbadense]TYH21328.1 hypothetical protein ES288_A04G035400v1 [Gossypium darwinii]